MFIRDVRRSGLWFPERGCILEHQICRFGKMILRDRCGTSYNLSSIFRGGRSTLDRLEWKNRKTHWYEAVSAALNLRCLKDVSQNCFVFDVVKNSRSLAELLRFGCCSVQKMKKSRRLASFLMLSNSKIQEVSQNYFVLDVVQFKKWRSLADLLRFWRCQVPNIEEVSEIASFLMLSTLKHEEVAKNCFVFDVVKFKHWGSLADLLRFRCCQLWKMKKARRIAEYLGFQACR